MALGLPTDQRGQIMALLVLGRAGGGLSLLDAGAQADIEKIGAARSEADSLERIVAAAKADLARRQHRGPAAPGGGVSGLARADAPPRAGPQRSPDADRRHLDQGQGPRRDARQDPAARSRAGQSVRHLSLRLEVFGHYDQIGEYLADIASLPRIVVPQDVTLSAATPAAQKLLADTAGALLLAEFSIRTFVKSAGPPPGQPKPGGARARS